MMVRANAPITTITAQNRWIPTALSATISNLRRKAQPGKPGIVIHSVTQIPDSNNEQVDRI
jgi:hypothetical protein